MKADNNHNKSFCYIALGDSLANGYGANGQGYPQQLLAKLQQRQPTQLQIFAKNGQTSAQLLKRWPTFSEAITTANLVTINIGGNDLRLTWRLYGHKLLPKKILHKRMDTALTTLANNCNILADKIVETVPKNTKVVFLDLYNPYQISHPDTNYFVNRANQQLQVICANHNFILIDSDALIKDRHIQSSTPPLAADKLHLNHTGYHLLAQAIFQRLYPAPIWQKAINAIKRTFPG